ncbi:MAG: hypothetical protein KF861_22995, partial [Planctomycetaceae bacterium]|nr:hypothetical protein [Planctomycetaceae bacterium]
MAKVIAVDRLESCLRYVLAEITGRSHVSILAVGEIDVPEDQEAATAEIGGQLRSLLIEYKATKARLLVGVGRGALEAVEFTVPAAEDSELPLLVRNLAMRNLSSIHDESVLDFLTAPVRNDGSRDVIAMMLRDDVEQETARLCAAADLSPERILVRPYELQTYVADPALQSRVVLVVSSSSQMVDVLLVHPEGWRLARSIRIAATASPSGSAGHVVNEIRRTLFALPLEDFDATHI